MKLKKILFLLLVSIIIFGSIHFIFTEESQIVSKINQYEFFPTDLQCVSSGNSYSTTGFDSERTLNSKNGKYAYFYIENIGDTTFSASVNNKEEHIFEPNDKGYICIEVKNGFLGRSKEYAFKAKAVEKSWGQEVGIYYMIGQKDN